MTLSNSHKYLLGMLLLTPLTGEETEARTRSEKPWHLSAVPA